MRPAKLPKALTLPAEAVASTAFVRDALGVSRTALMQWRRGAGFPSSHNYGNGWVLPVPALAAWLEARGVRVEIEQWPKI